MRRPTCTLTTCLIVLLALGGGEADAKKKLDLIDFATIAGNQDIGTLQWTSNGRRVFIDKDGTPYLRRSRLPPDLTGGRFVMVHERDGAKEILVLGRQGASGLTGNQITQSKYILEPGATRPRFERATTTLREKNADGISVMRFISKDIHGRQQSSMSAFKHDGPRYEKVWELDKDVSSAGRKVPSMRALSRRASKAYRRSIAPRRTTFLKRFRNIFNWRKVFKKK